MAPNVIAYPTKNGKKLNAHEDTWEKQERMQDMFDNMIEKVLPEVEHNLRKKRFLLIDSKSAKNIRNKSVSYKIYEEHNCL